MPTARLQTPGVGTVELVEQARISFRQADYWTRRGYLRAETDRPGTGHSRCYPASEVDVARAVRVVIGLGGEIVDEVAGMVRGGYRGEVELEPGVWLDLAVVCGPITPLESVA